MSTAKRLRPRQREPTSTTSPPAAKRVKTTNSHVPASRGLEFLVDEDARNGRRLEAKATNGIPHGKTTKVDEAHAIVISDDKENDELLSTHQAVKDDSSEDPSSDEESDDELEQENHAGEAMQNGHAVLNGDGEDHPTTNGHISDAANDGSYDAAVSGAEDTEMVDGAAVEEEEHVEPSFGDLLQARHPDPIDVQVAFPDPMADSTALVHRIGDRTLSAPSGSTLRTVLTQALKTNDRELLERCFQTTDLNSIRLTIERLSSQYISILLSRLAERIHRRPGRTGNLITWVQWSLVAHGAYLASQPEVMKKLRSLSQVLRERASGLQPLLRLKGKLDMLQAQLELRQRLAAESRAANAEDDDEEEGVVYVEGRDGDWTDGEGHEADDGDMQMEGQLLDRPRKSSKGKPIAPQSDVESSEDPSEDDDDSDDDRPNGIAAADDEDSDDEDQEGLLDIEAEESSGSDPSADSDSDVDDAPARKSVSSNEDPSSESESESEPDIKQPRPQRLNRKR